MVRVVASTVIAAPLSRVWGVLRDFNGHDRWHPAVARSRIEGGPEDRIGAVRDFALTDGAQLREQLLALSDREHSLRYCLLAAPIPLMGYVAQIRLWPVTDGDATFWQWSSEFQPPPGRETELVALVRDQIYRAGFAAVRRLVAPGDAPRVSATPTAPLAPAPLAAGADRTRAIVIDRHGGPEEMVLREVALAEPGPGQVRLRHTAIGVNFIDVYCRDGTFGLLQPPGTPGMEAAGVIEAVGPGVTDLAPGDRVAYACPPVGAYAAARVMAPDLLVRLGDDIPDATAAAGLLKGVSASFLLHDVARVGPGDAVLIHAAAGGIGQILVQWARALGARVIAAASTPDKRALARGLGAAEVIDANAADLAAEVRALTQGRGVDVVFDSAGRTTFAASLAALAPRGHLVSFGQAAGPVGACDIDALASRSLTISRPNYGHYTDTPERLAPHVARFFAAWRAGTIRLAAPTTYPLAEAAQAHRDLQSRRTTGALILIP